MQIIYNASKSAISKFSSRFPHSKPYIVEHIISILVLLARKCMRKVLDTVLFVFIMSNQYLILPTHDGSSKRVLTHLSIPLASRKYLITQ
jgi:hypothetical protein